MGQPVQVTNPNPFEASNQRFQGVGSNSPPDQVLLKDLLPGISDSQAMDPEYLRSAEFFEFAKDSCQFLSLDNSVDPNQVSILAGYTSVKSFIANFVQQNLGSKYLVKSNLIGPKGIPFANSEDLMKRMTEGVIGDFFYELRANFPTPYDIDKFIMEFLKKAYYQNPNTDESSPILTIIAKVEKLLRFVYGDLRYNHYKQIRGLRLSKFVEKTSLSLSSAAASKAKSDLKEDPFVAVYKYQDVLRAEENSLLENKQ